MLAADHCARHAHSNSAFPSSSDHPQLVLQFAVHDAVVAVATAANAAGRHSALHRRMNSRSIEHVACSSAETPTAHRGDDDCCGRCDDGKRWNDERRRSRRTRVSGTAVASATTRRVDELLPIDRPTSKDVRPRSRVWRHRAAPNLLMYLVLEVI